MNIKYSLQKHIVGFFLIPIVLSITTHSCESEDRFYRPDLPEKLCCIAVIDIDDTVNYDRLPYTVDARNDSRIIKFEKSFQSEFFSNRQDSLRDLYFTFKSSNDTLLHSTGDSSYKYPKSFKVPMDTEFTEGERYFLTAGEATTPEISSEIQIPHSPSDIKLISIHREIKELIPPRGDYTQATTDIINISFQNSRTKDLYYAILVEAYGFNFNSTLPINLSSLDFSIVETNTPGFNSNIPGQYMVVINIDDDDVTYDTVPAQSYFVDGSHIIDDTCRMKISVTFSDGFSPFEFILSYRIRLLSIPIEMYQFQKSLYLYKKVNSDPFSEPIYLKGNIKGGNGIFALCRSKEIIIKPLTNH